MRSGMKLGGVFVAEGFDKHGNKKWADTFHNVVTDTGIHHILDVAFCGGTATGTWYMGLLATTNISTASRLSTIDLATEISNATRPAYVEALSAQTLTNSANKSTFTIDKDATTVEGAFLASSNAVNGTTGILMSGAPFSGGAKVGDSGDKIIVTYTFVGSDDTSS